MTGFSRRGARGLATASGVFALALFGAPAAQAETLTFHPGPEQSFVVPSGVTKIKVTAVGERGGGASCLVVCFSRIPEVVSGTLTVKPGQTIYADFTGGGPGGGSDRGGNASDLRTLPAGIGGSLASRIVVAGGSGGEGNEEEGAFGGQGGNAGGANGEAGGPGSGGAGAGGGGTQTGGGGAGAGAGGANAGGEGSLGQGGAGGGGTEAGGGGGGGGGYYGGGGGGGGAFAGGGGGGGSSYIQPGAEAISMALDSGELPPSITVTYTGGTETITYTDGGEQSFVVPAGVTSIQVVATGANGHDGCGCGRAGLGARVTASLAVKAGRRFFVDFGGGGSSEYGPGGNAADLRTVSAAEPGTLASRLIVAGGGGGSGLTEENSFGGSGGDGGRPNGGAGTSADSGAGGSGATQSGAGAGGSGVVAGHPGGPGQGGSGGGSGPEQGAGGGGGYYGGGGGAGSNPGDGGSTAGGGGGSSYAAAVAEGLSYGQNNGKEPANLSIIYKSAAPPSATITTPTSGAHYSKGQLVTASYACSEGAAGPGLLAGGEGCQGPVANGAALDTSTAGEHTFTVTARSQDGLSASETVTYTVAAAPAPPTASITTPAGGAKYVQGQTVAASYSCTEGANGPGLKPGGEGCEGPVSNGSPIDTSTAGEHTFKVTARSQDGLSGSTSVSYEVIVPSPPSVSIVNPEDGAVYTQGQVADAIYSCSEGANGPGLKPGSEGCEGPVISGGAIDTSTTGEHAFTVTARSADGQSAAETVHYTVTPAAPTCSAAFGQGTFQKRHEGRFFLSDNLSTNLEGAQKLNVNYENGGLRFKLVSLTRADCTGEPGKRVFSGVGRARRGKERNDLLEFSISEENGGYYLSAKLFRGDVEVEVAGGPLRTKSQRIQ